MPWHSDADSSKHNRHATGKAGELWRSVANRVLASSGDDARAVREANAVLAKSRHAPRMGGKKRKS